MEPPFGASGKASGLKERNSVPVEEEERIHESFVKSGRNQTKLNNNLILSLCFFIPSQDGVVFWSGTSDLPQTQTEGTSLAIMNL